MLLDSDGTEYARFGDLEQFLAASPADFPATYEYTDGDYVVQSPDGSRVYTSDETLTADWKRIPVPFIPEHEFPRQPLDSDWVFVIFPDDDKDRPPQIYEDGEIRPLSPDLSSLGHDESGDQEQPITNDQDPQPPDTQEQAGSRQDDTQSTTDGSCEHGNDPESCIWCNA